jgi:glyoxylase-like metal-dependent hydrolase (beta-lactamase superfamily II)
MIGMLQISANLFLHQDTCNVYIIRNGSDAVLIDFGDGTVLKHLPELGIENIAAIMMTHHHRDQGQGLSKANGIPLYVPHSEQELFHSANDFWQARSIYNNYDMRQDRFSLLNSQPINGTLLDYERYIFAATGFTIIPTPGHTLGSITILAEIDSQHVAFTGDLIHSSGKVWSLAATQWTYNGAEGVAASIPSLLDLKNRQPELLLPSHGKPILQPEAAIDLTVKRLRELLDYRRQNPRMIKFIAKPYDEITPHLLWNRTSMSNAYVLLSDTGKALLIDFGYDFMTGNSSGSDRSSRRPWLYTFPMLKRDYKVQKIDVVLPTHYHDDHVAGLNLLRRVEGTEVWAGENFADILENPAYYDLPCLWYDPISVDRKLPLNQTIQWEEYTLTLYPLPGHTLYAVAIAFEVDGKRVLATGDQYEHNDGYNYVYKNRFFIPDYMKSATLYRQLNPELILTGHWDPYWVEPNYFDNLEERGAALERLHRELLPSEALNYSAEGLGAWIHPYQAEICLGECIDFEVEVLNPFDYAADLAVCFVAPDDWRINPNPQYLRLDAQQSAKLKFEIIPTAPVRRARVAVDITIAGQPFGQQAEALVTVKES